MSTHLPRAIVEAVCLAEGSTGWLAFRCGRYPSACYRLVREVTGQRWETVRLRGSRWVQGQLLAELKERSAGHN